MDHKKVEQTLKQIFDRYGTGILRERRKFEGALLDLLNERQYPEELLVLRHALDSTALWQMANSPMLDDTVAQKAVKQLQKESHMQAKDAEFVVRCMIAACGKDPDMAGPLQDKDIQAEDIAAEQKQRSGKGSSGFTVIALLLAACLIIGIGAVGAGVFMFWNHLADDGADRSTDTDTDSWLYIDDSEPEDDTLDTGDEYGQDTVAQITGNTSGNIHNLGTAVEKDGWIYYMDVKDKCINCTDGKKAWVLAEDFGTCLNLVDGWIYYCIYGLDGGNIYRIRTDGTGRELMAEGKCTNLTVTKDWMYFIEGENEGYQTELKRVSIQGREKETLAECTRDAGFALNGDWLYYYSCGKLRDDREQDSNYASQTSMKLKLRKDALKAEYGMGLYAVNVKNKEIVRLTADDPDLSDWIYHIVQADGWIYYFTDEEICRIRTDGTDEGKEYGAIGTMEELSILCGGSRVYFFSLNIADGWLYWQTDQNEIWRTDGTVTGCVLKNGSNPNILGDWVYFILTDEEEGQFLCRKSMITESVELLLVK